MTQKAVCAMCCNAVDSSTQPFIILNRYVVQVGHMEKFYACVAEDGECNWDDTGDPETNVASGPLLCWPDCARQWIDAQVLEGRAKDEKTRREAKP